MMAFSVVKKIGEGSYLDQDSFTIERARKARALNVHRFSTDKGRQRIKALIENGKLDPS